MKMLTLFASMCVFVAGLTTSVARAAAPDPMQSVLTDYLQIQDALARDTVDGVAAAAGRIQKTAPRLRPVDGLPMLPMQVGNAAKTLAAAKDLAAAREAFKGLSAPLVAWARTTKAEGVVALHCPMANADWLQRALPVRNPYYGSSMLTCGEQLAAGASCGGGMGCGQMGQMGHMEHMDHGGQGQHHQ